MADLGFGCFFKSVREHFGRSMKGSHSKRAIHSATIEPFNTTSNTISLPSRSRTPNRFSDTKLLLLLPSINTSSAEDFSSPISPNSAAAPKKQPPASSKKCKAVAQLDAQQEAKDGDELAVCIPAHRLVLVAKSMYFGIRLSTAVGSVTTSILREHAGCMEEVYAMEAVVEFMYTDKLPLLSESVGTQSAGEGHESCMSDLQRLLLRLTVADRWQVPCCVAACCTEICAKPTNGRTWDDCYALYNLPDSVTDQPCVSKLVDYTATIAVELANASSVLVTDTNQAFLSIQLAKLPASARLSMLEGCKLRFPGMLALLSSDDAVADSEDSLALLLAKYYASSVGRVCSAANHKKLNDQLRYQHMSNSFIGLDLPEITQISLDQHQLSQIVYLRGLTGFDKIPVSKRLSSIPSAWYEPKRVHANPPPDTVELTFKISLPEFVDYLQGTTPGDSGDSDTITLEGPTVDCRGVPWCIALQSGPRALFIVAVKPKFSSPDNAASRKTGIYATFIFRLDSAFPPIVGPTFTQWVGIAGAGATNFVQARSGRLGDQKELNWWKDYIVDEHVCFGATLKVM